MIGVDMKGLIDKCDSFCQQALNSAAGMTVHREHYEVCFEHFLLACLEEPRCDVALMLAAAGVDTGSLRAAVNRSLEQFRTGNSGRPVFSPTLQDVMEAGWLVSSVDLGGARLRSGGILLAFVRRPNFYAQGDYTRLLRDVEPDAMLRGFGEVRASSVEEQESALPSGPAADAANAEGKNGPAGEGFIARFCEDITAKADTGKLDPVFGRDQEIRQMVDILARRRKNNPILVGEPGVGKTAVMEGLALRITQGDVPETLRGVTLLGLDMGLLEAGASVKGEFERRLKGVLDEIKASPKSIILFIDEAHLLVGAGNAAGGSDAANLMKPALARGEIRTCAATTWKEYKKYFEKDPALARRFQVVKLDEPSPATTALILRGLRAGYEKSHGVLIRDEAIEAAADFGARYISGRFLPDKAIDLLDTACARVKVSLASRPAPLEDAIRRSQAGQRERAALERDRDEGLPVDEQRLAEIRHNIEEADAEAARLEQAWQEERRLAQALLDARGALNALRSTSGNAVTAPEAASETANGETAIVVADATEPQTEEEALEAVRAAREALETWQAGKPLINVEVNAETVARVVADWTGIPVGKVAREQAGQMALLGETLARRIKGQDAALAAVTEGIQAGKAGLRGPQQPLGVFLLVGPSGVGKTETGLALADALFGDESSIVTVNMSEFQEKHMTSRLIGSPPGYVGYGEGGLLTEAVRRKPYSVVLLDEAEKAHPDVMQLFYQVFDKGVLTDGEGVEVSFRNTVIMLTSNLGSAITQQLCADGRTPDADTLTTALRPTLSHHFQPALLARMTIVPYVGLTQEALRIIAEQKLTSLARRLHGNNGMTLTWDDALPAALAARCTETETGARNIDAVLAGSILPTLSRRILQRMTENGNDDAAEVHMSVAENGDMTIRFVDGKSREAAPEAGTTADEENATQ
ncbi:type VI secretion system ATPase TssH [uncultured Desulfovibrio sp.]|uniref:type VI secretion system ATPase TssH n=1 Tax=uncultured Desulfovibrio sp. TaxID=167968 RepID=UPI0026381793|nr:type VI secretion system ATPase TssH [uncultured Desulfovibrio sp.]